MNKAANSPDLLRLAILGLLTGGGTYGAMRLGHDITTESQEPPKPKDQLQLTLPQSRVKQANEAGGYISPGQYLGALLAMGGGAAGGFVGASSIYNHFRNKQLDDEIHTHEKDYLSTLERARQQASMKVASANTPNVDAFLQGIIEKIGEDGIGFAKEAMFGVDIPSESVGEFAKHRAANLYDSAKNTNLGSALMATWLALAGGGAGLTYWMGKKLDNQKAQNKAESTLPQEVKLNLA